MRSKILSLCLILAVALLLPLSVVAQSHTTNTFSIYSMYGLGDIQSQSTLQTRSMGGAGVAMRSRGAINLLNPASYSMTLQNSVMFDLGVQGTSSFNAQSVDGAVVKSNSTSINFSEFAFQMPITKGLGFAVSVSPFSSVGYRQERSEIIDGYGYVQYVNEGYGDISEVKAGLGWEPFKNFSLGVALQYYWGDIDRAFYGSLYSLTAGNDVISPAGLDNVSISKVKGQVGLQYVVMSSNRRALTIGATYDFGGDLTPRYSRYIGSMSSDGNDVGTNGNVENAYIQSDTTTMSIVLPNKGAAGVNFVTEKIMLSLDYSYQSWGRNNVDFLEISSTGVEVKYNNVGTVSVGAEYTPRRSDVRNYFNRVSYRAGARYGGYQYSIGGKSLNQYVVTVGAGLPINMAGISKVNVGLEWGGVGSVNYAAQTTTGQSVGLVRQNYLKFSLGFTLFGDDYWFRRPVID
ncbi:MAG: hypothetical protein SNH79_04220 [Rikenellaceae bacterium]